MYDPDKDSLPVANQFVHHSLVQKECITFRDKILNNLFTFILHYTIA